MKRQISKFVSGLLDESIPADQQSAIITPAELSSIGEDKYRRIRFI